MKFGASLIVLLGVAFIVQPAVVMVFFWDVTPLIFLILMVPSVLTSYIYIRAGVTVFKRADQTLPDSVVADQDTKESAEQAEKRSLEDLKKVEAHATAIREYMRDEDKKTVTLTEVEKLFKGDVKLSKLALELLLNQAFLEQTGVANEYSIR